MCERHYREQKVSDLTALLLIRPHCRWQASVVHLEQAYYLVATTKQWNKDGRVHSMDLTVF